MNIFVVDHCPRIAASELCDKHVVKMILESSQLLCTAHHILGSLEPRPTYFLKATHGNHPCAVWARKAVGNYDWLAVHNMALCVEYTFRYDKRHKCDREGLAGWLMVNRPRNLPAGETPFAQAMPEEFRREDPVAAYRAYYLGAKRSLLAWTEREPPHWVPREWLEEKNGKWKVAPPWCNA